MFWFLPLIIIGGLFIPLLGYLVVAMMALLLTLAYFKGRFWCWYLCPRGAFLDIALSKLSRKRSTPELFTKQWFRWSVFVLFIGFLILRIMRTGGNLIAVGSVFVAVCLLTTVIAVILGLPTKHRAWCLICPMGTLQEKVNKISQKRGKR